MFFSFHHRTVKLARGAVGSIHHCSAALSRAGFDPARIIVEDEKNAPVPASELLRRVADTDRVDALSFADAFIRISGFSGSVTPLDRAFR